MDRVLWDCVHRHAWPVVPWVRLTAPEHFALDRELIVAVGRARSAPEVERELSDFASDYRNRDWWRRVARLRISTRRLRRLVRHHLAAEENAPGAARTS